MPKHFCSECMVILTVGVIAQKLWSKGSEIQSLLLFYFSVKWDMLMVQQLAIQANLIVYMSVQQLSSSLTKTSWYKNDFEWNKISADSLLYRTSPRWTGSASLDDQPGKSRKIDYWNSQNQKDTHGNNNKYNSTNDDDNRN